MPKDNSSSSRTPRSPKKLPGSFVRMRAEYPEVLSAYEAFAKATESAGPLSKRDQRLIKLGLTFGARMEGGAHSAIRKALEAGITPAEIRQAAILAMTTIGFPNAMAAMSWVRDICDATDAAISAGSARSRK